MGLFSTLSAINATADLVTDLATNEKVKNALYDVTAKGLGKIGTVFDTDQDGDFDNDDKTNLLQYAEMIASVLGQAAMADGVVNAEEEDEAWEVLQRACFDNGGILTSDILEIGNIRKKDVKKQLTSKFNKPNSLRKIAKYAIEKELEEDFYEMACIIISSDNEINEDEKEFIVEFAEVLELSRFDVKRINKIYIKL